MATLEGTAWKFGASYTRKQKGEDPWHFRLGLLLDQESGGGGAGQRVRVADVTAPDCDVTMDKDGTAVITAPASTSTVTLRDSARTSALSPGAGGVGRVCLRLDIRPLMAA